MQDAGYAALQIIPSFDGFQGHLERGSSGALIAAGRSGGTHFGTAAGKSAGSRFGSVFKSTIAALGLYQLGRAGLNFLGDSVAEARESQKVGALTEQVIKSTGRAAGVSAKEVGDLSTALSLKTGVDDEVIQRGANMLLTFKNVRDEVGKNNDIFSQSVAITEDMAAAMAGGQGGNQLDLKSSSILVGKALNDPVKGLTALTRVGVSFTDQQKKNIESLVEQNKQSEAQKIILGELQSEFGGAAEAQATMGEKVSVAWGNIQEKIGTGLLPLIHDVERAFLREGVPALNRFSDWFQHDGTPAIRSFVDDAKPFIHSLLPAAATVFDDVRGAAKAALPVVKGVIDAFNDMPDWAQKAIVAGGATAVVGSKLGVGSLLSGSGRTGGGILGGLASKAAPLPVFVTNPGFGGTTGLPGGRTPPVTPAPGGPGLLTTVLAAAGFAMVNSNPKNVHPERPGLDTSNVGSEADLLALERYRSELEQTSDLFKTLPTDLQTKVVLYGAPESKREALSLAKAYDLTKEQRSTLFKVLGIPQAKSSTNELIDILVNASKPRHGQVTVDTSDAQARADRLLATLNNINRLAALHSAGIGPAAPSAPRTGSRAPRRGATINVHLDGKKVGEIFDERIGTYDDLADERRRAGAPQ